MPGPSLALRALAPAPRSSSARSSLKPIVARRCRWRRIDLSGCAGRSEPRLTASGIAVGLFVPGEAIMALRKFIIERDIPAVGSLEREQLRAAAAKSNEVLSALGPDIQWQESYVAADKTFCVYLAKDEGIIRKHAEISGFPASKITEVRKMIDPTTERAD
jgi:Protein of unknown function (DUF4242)